MTMEEHSEDEEVPSLIPIGTKRKLDEKDSIPPLSIDELKKKKMLKLSKMVKPPTAEELSRLRETENLFHSNMFRLQIEEMLKEVKPKDNVLKKADTWVKSISEFIENIETCDDVHELKDNDWLRESNIHVPLVQYPEHEKGTFQFIKPNAVNIVGSFSATCVFGPKVNVDLAIEMPKKMLQTGDHLNEKYFRKKMLYLCFIAHQIEKNKSELNIQCIEYKLNNDNIYTFSLLLTPCISVSKKILLNILAVPQEKSFKLSKLHPSINNIRSKWLLGAEIDDNDSVLSPTPIYNTFLARDVLMNENEIFRRKIFQEHANLVDAFLLLSVWLHQRQLDKGLGTMSRWALSLYVVYLFNQKKLNSHMSSYQIVRNVWIHLADSQWNTTGISLNNSVDIETYLKYFPVVFIDVTGLCNMASDISLDSYLLIKEQSKLALSCLDDLNLDSFRLLFMTPAPFSRQFDHYISVNDVAEIRRIINKHICDSDRLDRGVTPVSKFITAVTSFLKDVIGIRIDHIVCRTYPESRTCNLHEDFNLLDGKVILGLRLNSSTCFTVIHKGPEANLPEAFHFRQTWGNKSELRRFKDGTVCEATVWGSSADTLAQKRSITKQIILYLLNQKFDIREITYVADQLDEKLKTLQKENQSSTGEEASIKAISIFDELNRNLRDLKDLPLDISSVYPISGVLRYTDPIPTVPQTHKDLNLKLSNNCCAFGRDSALPSLVKPIEAVIEFIQSNKWPDDLGAIYRLKAAFYIDLSNKLKSQFQIPTKVVSEYLDVYKLGLVFRLKLYCPSEIALLKKDICGGVVRFRQTQDSFQLEQQLLHLPTLHGALHGLHQQHPVFGPTCCLVKRWLNSQLLDSFYWPEICVELLVASLVTTPLPFTCSIQPQVMFIRFLQLLTEHNFQTDPILVNFNNELLRKNILHVETVMRNDRKSLPPLVLVTPFDTTGVVWTKLAPNLTTLIRTMKLAVACLEIIENDLLKDSSLDPIFKFPKDDFNVIINLNKSAVSVLKSVVPIENNESDHLVMPIVDFNPVASYLATLRGAYGEMALFFYDEYGGLKIGVVFKPVIFLTDKNMQFNCKMPNHTSTGTLEFINNTKAMLEDFYILGRGLVRSIVDRNNDIVESPFRQVK